MDATFTPPRPARATGERRAPPHAPPQPLPPAFVLPPPFDYTAPGGGADMITTPRPRHGLSTSLDGHPLRSSLIFAASSPHTEVQAPPPRQLADLAIRQPVFCFDAASSDPSLPCAMDDDTGLEGLHLSRANVRVPLHLHPVLDAENIPPESSALTTTHNANILPVTAPDAPRKKPPTSPHNLQNAATASASKCRERLAAAARSHRNQSATTSPSNSHSTFNETVMDTDDHARKDPRDLAEHKPTFTGTRKRLDDTLDDVMGFSLVTPKRMRAAEELFSKMNI